MESLPEDVAASLTRGISAYLKATPAAELPPALRRWQKFRPQALAQRRDRLFAALEDPVMRSLIVQWLDDGRAPVSKADEQVLRLACERPEGWERDLTGRSAGPAPPRAKEQDQAGLLAEVRRRAQKARKEARVAKDEARKQVELAGLRAEEAARSAARLQEELAASRRAQAASVAQGQRLTLALEGERRKGERAVRRANKARDEARSSLKEARAEAASLRRALATTKRSPAPARSSARETHRARPGRRTPLTVPPGRLGDDALTLDDWLKVPAVQLLVDGYNVAKAEKGFGDLELPRQRQRLAQEVDALARRNKIAATIVFDGAQRPPGTARRSRLAVAVEYSRPDEIADDHLVARLAGLPPDPVVVITNDKELQARTRELGATIASSDQLLSLIRKRT